MGKPTGFKEFDRELPGYRKVEDRVQDYKEITVGFPEEKTINQAARCMNCGVPFCHNGCPLGNIIPEFNDAVFEEDWELAFDILRRTNNFPEFTGRICPAPCEKSCVLGITNPPVAIEHIEKSIAEKAHELGYYAAYPPRTRTGKNVAVVGSGPSGLAVADQLNKAGHTVTIFERAEKPGGLLRYGIPDFKLDKRVVERRVAIMEEEGIIFKCSTNVGVDITTEELQNAFDAIVLCGGSTKPRDLNIPGRDLKGVHFAMDFLSRQNKKVSGEWQEELGDITASGKHVVVIGGGDTGSDCVGTSNRHGAASVTQIELLAKPPSEREPDNPWPQWPMTLRTSSSHLEGCEREWAILTKEFVGDENGNLKAIKLVNIKWAKGEDGRFKFEEVEGTERTVPCELALLAVGFVHPQLEGMLESLGVALDKRKNVHATNYKTSVEKVFTAGDMHRGQSLVVWAISEGREAAREVDIYLMGSSQLESKDDSLVNTIAA
ncbi:MAG: glutamate synthase subunit beta [Bacteroidota bacterium]